VSNLEQLVNDPGVHFEVTYPDAAPATAAWDNPLFVALEAACRTHAPGALVTPSICVGGTDARYFRQRGVPAFGLVPCLFTADDLKGYHGIDERLSTQNLELGMKIIFDTVRRAATA
jgi:acetylornithine deacetylase/succinyl-diaminopimelate desuccinylase-like protein